MTTITLKGRMTENSPGFTTLVLRLMESLRVRPKVINQKNTEIWDCGGNFYFTRRWLRRMGMNEGQILATIKYFQVHYDVKCDCTMMRYNTHKAEAGE